MTLPSTNESLLPQQPVVGLGAAGSLRRALGRFSKGAKGGPGNPYASQVSRWRSALYECVTDEDIREVMRTLVNAAKQGHSWAIHELLNRLVGKPPTVVATQVIADN